MRSIAVGLALCALPAVLAGEAAERRPRFKLLFHNDLWNVTSCISPYHKRGEPFGPEMLEASVDETAAAGVDCHVLYPGGFWVPYWQSKLMPPKQHWEWIKKQGGPDPDSTQAYVRDGGDVIDAFARRCREKGIAAFVGMAMNHGGLASSGPERFGWVSRFFEEHPELRLKGVARWNWAKQEVRDHRFALLEEVCEKYEIDGVFLDFLRFCHFFEDSFPMDRRVEIMTGFVRRVRDLLDRTAKPGQRRWLAARVPHLLYAHAGLGIDLVKMADAGLDLAVVSSYYYTNQQTDLGKMRGLAPRLPLYLEMTYCNWRTGLGGARRATTDEQFYTTAHLAHRRGADGFMLFNFVYYRLYHKKEPPWHVVRRLHDVEWLAGQARWYFVDQLKWYYHPRVPAELRPMPQRMVRGDTHTFELDMAALEQSHEGILRLKASTESLSRARIKVCLNGTELQPRAYVHKPLPHPYERGLGQPSEYACFVIPPRYKRDVREYFYSPPPKLVDGINKVAVTVESVKGGGSVWFTTIDVVLPPVHK